MKLTYWQVPTAASQVFILKIIIFNSSWLISLKLKLALWQLGMVSQRTDLEDVRNKALLPSDISNLGMSHVCTTEDGLERGSLTQRRVADEAEVGTFFFSSPGCPCSAAIRSRRWVPERDVGRDAWSEQAPMVSHLHAAPWKSSRFPS